MSPSPAATYRTSGRRQLLPAGRTSTLLYLRGGMKLRVVLAQRQLRLPLASRRAVGSGGHTAAAHAPPKIPPPSPKPPQAPQLLLGPTCQRASVTFNPPRCHLRNSSPSLPQHPAAPAWARGPSPASPGGCVASSTPRSRAARAAMPAHPAPHAAPI